MSTERIQITSLPAQKLEKLSRRQVALVERSLRLLGETPAHQLADTLNDVLSHYLRTPFRFESTTFREPIYERYLSSISDPCFLAVLNIHPSGEKAVLELDQSLALDIVERMLGGKSADGTLRGLSEIEQQLLRFLLLKLLAQLHKRLKTDSFLRLDKIAVGAAGVREVYPPETSTFLATINVEAGSSRGFARLCMPHPFLQSAKHLFPRRPPPDPGYFRRSLSPDLLSIKVPFWVEIGRVSLSREEIENIGMEDILLLDHTLLRLEKDEAGLQKWAGGMDIRIGKGYHGIEARIAGGTGPIHLEIVGFRNADMDSADEERKQDAGETSEEITEEQPLPPDQVVGEVIVPVVAAVGRTDIDLKRALELRRGQVLRLDRAPGDPVDILVNGELRARGELVDVEGQLGVRVTELALPGKPG